MLNWPFLDKDKLILGNDKSPLAICTLWSKKENFLVLPKEKFSVIGNLYTTYGINHLIKNLLANPRIKYLVVCGEDLSKAGEALINLFKNGLDENHRIIGSKVYIDKSIPKDKIEILRKNIEVFDLRNEENVSERIVEIAEKVPTEIQPFIDPVLIKEEESEEERLISDEVGFKVEGKTIADTWLKILDLVMKFGEIKESEYKIKQKEILDVVAIVKGDGKIPDWFPVSQEILEEYSKQFFTKDKPKGVDYSYGERLFGLELSLPSKVKEYIQPQILKEANIILNQINLIIKKLKSKKFTRRAIAVTWRHEIDSVSENPPCLIEIVWNIKDEKLHQTCTFRSHDIWGAWLFNAFALRNLQKEVSRKVGIEAGNLIIFSVSAHIYENNWKSSTELLEKYYNKKEVEFEDDPRGFFIIKLENGEIVVEHRLKDGRKSKYEFKGKNAEELYKKILNENLVSRLDHAAYLGKELARAQKALEEGKEYKQE
ncbi:MAG: thymidylate synthase [Candidatus Aenigmatarchaeota archaeon]